MDSLVSIFLLTCLLSLSTAQIPGPVQNLVINNIQQWGFTAAWNPPATGTTPELYNVTITNTNTNDLYERSLLPKAGGSYEIDHLYDDTNYTFSVVAVNSDGQGGSAVENTGINIPPCQLCLSDATVGPGVFQLTFPATGMNTLLSGTSVDASTQLTVSQLAIGPTHTSVSYLGLPGGLLYELQMTIPSTGDIVYSSRYRTVPHPVTNLLLSPDSSTSVQVTYEQPIGFQYDKYDGFRITYGDQQRFVGSSDTSVVTDGLQAGISYPFEVQTFSGELADRSYSTPATGDIILGVIVNSYVPTLKMGSNEILEGDSAHTFTFSADAVTGNGIPTDGNQAWQIEVFVSLDSEGTNPLRSIVLEDLTAPSAPNSQIEFSNLEATLNLSGLMCNEFRHFCARLSVAPGANFSLSGTPTDSVLLGCIPQELICQGTNPNLRVPDFTDTTLTVEWDPSIGDFDSYLLTINPRDGLNPENSQIKSVGTYMYKFTGLTPGDKYTVTIQLIKGAMQKGPVFIHLNAPTTLLPSCPALEIPASEVTSFEIVATWPRPEGYTNVKSYSISITPSTGVTYVPLITNPFTLTNDEHRTVFSSLTPAQTYMIEVTANAINAGPESPAGCNSRTVVAKPAAVVLQVADFNTTSVSLAWSVPLSVTPDGYVLTIGILSAVADAAPAPVDIPGANMAYIVPSLLPGVEYSFTVQAYQNVLSTRAFGDADTVVQRTIPDVASGILGETMDTSIALSWTPPPGKADYYLVMYDPIYGSTITPSEASNPEFNIKGLDPGIEYEVSIISVAGSARSSAASETFMTDLGDTNLIRLKEITATSLSVTWSPNAFATAYTVSISPTGGNPAFPVPATNRLFAEFSGLSEGTVYTVTLVATPSSSPPLTADFKTNPSPPGPISASNVLPRSATLSWSASSGADAYSITLSSGENVIVEMSTTDSSVDLVDLEPDTMYSVVIFAESTQQGLTSQSGEQSVDFETLPAVISLGTITTTSVRVLGTSDTQRIEYTPSDGSFISGSPGVQGMTILEDLTPGQEYTITITVDSANVDQVSFFTYPEVPQGVGLTLSDPDTSSVLVEYDAPSSGMHDGYLITYSGVSVGADGNEPSPITAEASSTQRTITGLTPGTVYTVTVQSIVNDGNTVSSTTTRSISTEGGADASFYVFSKTTNSIIIKFAQIGVTNTATAAEQNGPVTNGDETNGRNGQFTFMNLTPGTVYDVTLIISRAGQSAVTTSQMVQTLPNTPTSVAAVSSGESPVITVTWQPVDGGVSSYRLHLIPPAGGVETSLLIIAGSDTSYVFDDVQPSTEYDVTVTAVARDEALEEESYPATVQVTTDPRTFTFTITTTSFVLSFEAVGGALIYEMYDGIRDSQTFSTLPYQSPTDYEPGSLLQVTVFALTSNGETLLVGSQDVLLKPEQVSDFRLITESEDTLIVSGINPGNGLVDIIEIEYGTEGLAYILPSVSEKKIEFLQQNTLYPVMVYAVVYAGGLSQRSDVREKSAATQTGLQASPVVTEITTNTIAISWRENQPYTHHIFIQEKDTDVILDEASYVTFDQTTTHTFNVQPATLYQVTIETINSLGGIVDTNSKDVRSLPEAVTFAQMTSVDLTSIALIWDIPDNARSDGFEVRVLPPPSPGNYPIIVNDQMYTVRSLRPGTVYDIQVLSLSGQADNCQTFGTPFQIVTATESLDVLEIVAVDIYDTRASVEFSATNLMLQDVNAYEIAVTPSAGGMAQIITVNRGIYTADITDLIGGTSYDVLLSAVLLNNEKDNDTATTTFVTLPKAPVSVTEVSAGFFSFTVELEPPANSSYDGFVITANGESKQVLQAQANYQATFENLIIGETYSVDAYSFLLTPDLTSQVLMDFTPVSVTTATPAPGEVTVQSITSPSITVSWRAVPGASQYSVTISPLEGQRTENILSRKVDFTQLTPGRLYMITLISTSPTGDLESSVMQRTAPSPPSALVAETLNADDTIGLQLSWALPTTGEWDAIKITYTPMNGVSQYKMVGRTVTSTILEGLYQATEYTLDVRSVSGLDDLAEESEPVSQTALTRSLPADTMIITMINETMVSIIWTIWDGITICDVVDQFTVTVDSQSLDDSRVTLTNLVPASLYRVSVTDLIGGSGVIMREFRTAPSPPSKIEVTKDESNDVEITFTWTSSPGAEFYHPTLVRPDGIKLSHPDGDVPATSQLVATFKGLQSGTAYELIVRSGLYLFSQFPEILSRALTTEHTTGVISNTTVTEVAKTSSSVTLALIPPNPSVTVLFIVVYTDYVTRITSVFQTYNDESPLPPIVEQTIPGLSPATTYRLSISWVDDNEEYYLTTLPSSPTILNVFPSSDGQSVLLNWSPPVPSDNVFGYKILYSPSEEDDAETKLFAAPMDTSRTVLNLVPGVPYTFSLSSLVQNQSGDVFLESEPLVRTFTLDTVPGQTYVLSRTNSSIEYIWTQLNLAQPSYFILTLTSDGVQVGDVVMVSGSSRPSAWFDGLQSGTEYELTVNHYSLFLLGTPTSLIGTNSVITTTSPASEGVPVLVDRTTTTISISWGASTDALATGYQLRIRPEGGTSILFNLGQATTIYIFINLESGTNYIISLQIVGLSEAPQELPVTTYPQTPGAIQILRTTQTSITFAWGSAGGNFDRYSINLYPDGSQTAFLQDVPRGSDLTVSKNYLAPETLYRIEIYAATGTTRSALRDTTASTGPRVINVVETGRNLKLSWANDFGNDILKYQLIYIEDKEGATSNSEFVDPSDVPSVTLMNLMPGQTYTLILMVVRTSGNRAQNASTTYTLKPLRPTFTVNLHSPSAVSLLGNLLGGILKFFRVRVTPQVTGAGAGTPIGIDVFIPVEACPEIELTGLIPNTDYQVTLQAESGVASSDPQIITFTTPPLTQQGQLSFGEVTPSGFTVYWSPFLGLTSYEFSISNQAGRVVPASGDAVQSYAVDGLSSGTQYTVSLVNGGTDTIRTRPLAPGTPIATQVLDTSIQLQWTQSSDGSVAGFEICYSPDDGSGPAYIAGRTTTQFTLEGLNSDTTYIISISALTGNPQVKSQKQTISVTTIADTTIPMASNFALTNTLAADHAIILGWDVPERASYDYFEVSYTPDVGYPSSPVRLSQAATGLSIMNALADTVYRFNLVSIRGEERTDPPLTTTGQIAVNNLIVVIGERTTTSLEILWGEAGSVDEYQVSYGGTTPILVDGSSNRRVVIPGLSPGTEYTVTVQAINAGASVGSSMETASTLHEMNRLSATVTDQASSMIHLTITPPFEDPMRYDGYNVRVRLGGVSSPVVQPAIPVAKSACPEIWIKKLEAATMYEIDIEWYNGLDISEAFRVQTSTVAAAPLDITLDELETDSMKVSWQEGTGSFSYYLVTYSPVGSMQTPMLVAKGEPRVLDLSGLVPGTAYTIMVQQQGQTSAQETHVQLTMPEAINSLSVTPSKNALDATWSAPSTGNYDGYRVCHYPRGTQNSLYTSGTTPSINLPGLNSLTYYLVTVLSSEESTYSEPTTITQQTLIGDPGDINIALEDVDTNSVRITWVAINTITRYTIGGGTQAQQTVTVNSPEEAEYTFTNLEPGTSYTFFVTPLGTQRREREQYTKPDMPRNLLFNTITTNSISIDWESPLTGGVDSYRVTYSPSSVGSPASPHDITDNGQATQTLTVTNLLPGTTYTFNVYALVAELVSEPVTRGSGTTIGMDIAPGYISTQFTVLWNVPTSGDFNQFQVTYDPYDPTNPNAQESPRIISVSSLNGAQEGSLLIYGLEPGQLYNVYVQTMLNGMQTDDGFGRISFRTPPLPVTDVVITQRTPYSLSLDWSDVTSADIQYRITYAPLEGALFPNNEDSAQVLSSNQVSESQIVARSLAPGKEYVFTISPVSGDPSSFEQVGQSQTVVTYTQPLSPQNLVVSDVGVEEFSLSWNLPAEVNSPIAYYEIDLVPNEPTFPIRINSTRDRWEIYDGLVSGREYQAVMRSVINDVNGQVIYSEPVQSAFFLLEPLQPQSLSTPYVTTSELRVEWTLGNSDYDTFQVSFSKDLATILTTYTPERSLLLTNLTVATVYDISIRTVVQGPQTNMIKTSAGALIMAVTTKSEPPQNLMQDEVTSDSITVSWGAPLNVVNMYHIIVKDEDGADVADATVPSSETSYTIENLNPYTKYIISVAARFNGLDSDAIEIEQTTFQGSAACSPLIFLNASFPDGREGDVVDSSETCPIYTTSGGTPIGRAECVQNTASGELAWNITMYLNDCGPLRETNEVVDEIIEKGVTNETVIEVLEVVVVVTDMELDEGNIVNIANIISNSTALQSGDPGITTLTATIISNFAEKDKDELSAVEENTGAITQILESFEEQLNNLDISDGQSYTALEMNVAVQVTSVEPADFSSGLTVSASSTSSDLRQTDITLNDGDSIVQEEILTGTRVSIPSSVLNDLSSEDGSESGVRLALTVFSTSSLFTSQHIRGTNAGQSSFNRTVNSLVIGLTLGRQKMATLGENIVFKYTPLQSGFQDPECVFWDFEDTLDWSSRGCRKIPSSVSDQDGEITCSCDHLTNFAVLMDIYYERVEALRIISIIGCAISIVCLVIILITYLSNKNLHVHQSQKIFMCLCGTLLGLYLTFLIMSALDRHPDYPEVTPVPCGILAALVHFFTLSSMAWMGVEGINTYLIVVRVFDAYIPRFMLKASIVAWGVSGLIVLLTGLASQGNYAATDYCFLQKWPSVGGLLIPIAIILLANIVIFSLVVRRLIKSANVASNSDAAGTNRKASIERIKNAVSVLLLLGLTWVTGYLTLIDTTSQVTQTLFIVFNSLQGFFIFILYCARNPVVRAYWAKVCGCGQDSSRTSTRANQGTSQGISLTKTKSTSENDHDYENPSFDENKEYTDLDFSQGKKSGDPTKPTSSGKEYTGLDFSKIEKGGDPTKSFDGKEDVDPAYEVCII